MNAGKKIVCPLCRRKLFVTTEHYNPDISPNGSMLKFLGGYYIDFLCASTTGVAELTCPECQAQLAPSGRLTVIEEPKTIMETEEAIAEQLAWIDKAETPIATLIKDFDKEVDEMEAVEFPKTVEIKGISPKVGAKVYTCETCGKEFGSALALSGHSRSHKEKTNAKS